MKAKVTVKPGGQSGKVFAKVKELNGITVGGNNVHVTYQFKHTSTAKTFRQYVRGLGCQIIDPQTQGHPAYGANP